MVSLTRYLWGSKTETEPSKEDTSLESVVLVTPSSEPEIGIFWDHENMQIPEWCSAAMAAEYIRDKVSSHGKIVERKLYFDSKKSSQQPLERSSLDLSGFSLVDCPSRTNNNKETLDKKVIVDMLCFAWERVSKGSTVRVVLISSDGDYSYTLAKLRDIGVSTVVVYTPMAVASILIDVADEAITWEEGVLGGRPIPKQMERRGTTEEHFQAARRPKPTRTTDDHTVVFLRAVLGRQEKYHPWWALECNTGTLFHQLTLPERTNKAIYRLVRADALQKNYVQVGRKDLTRTRTPVIICPEFQQGKRSLHTYLRLTALGRSTLQRNNKYS